MFDFTLAVAKCDNKGMGYSFAPIADDLRDRHPDLDFLFDELDDYRFEAGEFGSPADMLEARNAAQTEQKRLYDLVDDAEERFSKLRDMAVILTKLSKANESDLAQLANKADDAYNYFSDMKDG